MLKVLHIGLSSTFGGIESFLLNISKYVDDNRIQFDYVAYSDMVPRIEEFKRKNAIFHLRNRKNIIKYVCDLKKILSNNYDIVHIHKNSAVDIVPFVCAKLFSKACIISHSHNGGSSSCLVKIISTFFRPIIVNISDELLSCSNVATKWLYGNVDSKKVYLVPNGIYVDKYKFNPSIRSKIRRKMNLEDNFVIGCVGRFVKQKNQIFLVDVLDELIKVRPKVKLLFLGDGKEIGNVQAAFNRRGLTDYVVFRGAVSNIQDYLQAMDVAVMPSIYEGLPLSAIEFQASGLPTIVSDSITDEINLSDSFTSLPITKGPMPWVNALSNIHCSNRDYIDQRVYYYDTMNTSKMLIGIYESIRK